MAIDPITGLATKTASALKRYLTPTFNPATGAETNRDAQGGYGPTVGTAPPTTPGLPGSISTPGFVPDYKNLIANDPVFKQLQADLQAQGYGDLASRNAALNRLFTGFGALPDINQAGHDLGINDLGQAVDPATAQLAAENPYSTQTRLGQAHTDALRQIKQGLAARHALQSGELGYQVGNENRAYGQAQNDATQALLDSIAQLQGGYTAAQKAAQAQLNQGLGQATDRQIGLNPARGSQTATLDPATGKYQTPDGKWWNADGTPIIGAPAPQAAAPPPPPAASTVSSGGLTNSGGGLYIPAQLAPGVYSGHRLDPRYQDL